MELNAIRNGFYFVGCSHERGIHQRAYHELPRTAGERLTGAQALRMRPIHSAQQSQCREASQGSAGKGKGHVFLGLLFALLFFLESDFLLSDFFSEAFLAASLAFFSPLL